MGGYSPLESPRERRARLGRAALAAVGVAAAVLLVGARVERGLVRGAAARAATLDAVGTTCSDDSSCETGYRCAGGMCISLARTSDGDDDAAGGERDDYDDDYGLGNSSTLLNVTKMTWAVSDVVAARRWFRKYLATQKATDGCTPDCSCGDQGRVELNGTVLGYQSMFGLHTVDSFSKPSGPLSLARVEAVFSSKLGGMTGYVDVMDFSMGLFVLDLDPWLETFKADGISVYPFQWTSADDKAMVSVVVRVTGLVLLELCSEHQTYFESSELAVHPRRFAGSIARITEGIEQDLVPLWASRASSNVTRDYAFYRRVVPGTSLAWAYNDTASGVAMRYLTVKTGKVDFELHFVERPPDNTGGMTIADLEGYFREVHSATVRSPFCGWDVWFDNHVGIDHCGGWPCPLLTEDHQQRAVAMDAVYSAVRSEAVDRGATYRLWKQQQMNGTGRWLYNMYIVEPGGMALQVNGFLHHAPDSLAPVWNESLCGQGNCSNPGVGGPPASWLPSFF